MRSCRPSASLACCSASDYPVYGQCAGRSQPRCGLSASQPDCTPSLGSFTQFYGCATGGCALQGFCLRSHCRVSDHFCAVVVCRASASQSCCGCLGAEVRLREPLSSDAIVIWRDFRVTALLRIVSRSCCRAADRAMSSTHGHCAGSRAQQSFCVIIAPHCLWIIRAVVPALMFCSLSRCRPIFAYALAADSLFEAFSQQVHGHCV